MGCPIPNYLYQTGMHWGYRYLWQIGSSIIANMGRAALLAWYARCWKDLKDCLVVF